MPCIGTGAMLAWQLTAHGKLFHSGLPNKSVNPMELAMEALAEIQKRFYRQARSVLVICGCMHLGCTQGQLAAESELSTFPKHCSINAAHL